MNQGLILGEDGEKMSKSRGNVVNPDDVIAEYGADALRCYEMFMGPLEATKPWSMKGVEGVARFLARVWRLVHGGESGRRMGAQSRRAGCPGWKSRCSRSLHATIKKVGEDIETFSLSTLRSPR